MTDWSRHFDEPISLPDGSELETLYDAGRYIEALPKAKHERPEWRVATEILLSAAEGKVPITFADVVIRRAVDASQPAPPEGIAAQDGQEIHGPVTVASRQAMRFFERDWVMFWEIRLHGAPSTFPIND